jgi:hypothetical protein
MNAALRRAEPGWADLCKHSSPGGSDVRTATSALARSHGWADYQERLARVTVYIHDHLAVGPGLGPRNVRVRTC